MLKKNINKDEMLKLYSPDAPFEIIEAYNSLVTNIIRLSNEEHFKSIAITSAAYGEGKATVAINIATALAENLLDKKILLIDSDLRSSNVSEFLDFSHNNGLSNYLSTDCDDPQIHSTSRKNLDVIAAGDVKSNPTGLLRSDKMGGMLKALEDKYDYIIIDTAPVNDYADALFLADRVAGYIFSTKRKASSVSKIDLATARVESAGAEIIGFVFAE